MDPVSVEIFLAVLIAAYVLMSGVFWFSQKNGHTFVASFDKAMVWGSGAFLIGCGLSAATYMAGGWV